MSATEPRGTDSDVSMQDNSHGGLTLSGLPVEVLGLIVEELRSMVSCWGSHGRDGNPMHRLRLVNSFFDKIVTPRLFDRAEAQLNWDGLLHLEILANCRHSCQVRHVDLICPRDPVEGDGQLTLGYSRTKSALRSCLIQFKNLRSLGFIIPSSEPPAGSTRGRAAKHIAESIAGLRFPNLERLALHSRSGTDIPEIVAQFDTDDRHDWWVELCNRLRSLDLRWYRDDYQDEDERILPSLWDPLLQPLMRNFKSLRHLVLETIEYPYLPAVEDCWLSFERLESITLSGLTVSVSGLQTLLARNASTLRVISWSEVHLTGPSYWEEIFDSLGRLDGLTGLHLYELSYDKFTPQKRGVWREPIWMSDPEEECYNGFLYSSRWRDHHALRDLLVIAQAKLLTYQQAVKAQRAVQYYCSVDDYLKWDSMASRRTDDERREHSTYDSDDEDLPKVF